MCFYGVIGYDWTDTHSLVKWLKEKFIHRFQQELTDEFSNQVLKQVLIHLLQQIYGYDTVI